MLDSDLLSVIGNFPKLILKFGKKIDGLISVRRDNYTMSSELGHTREVRSK